MSITLPIPDPEQSWAQVELFRWQYGELPQPNEHRQLDASIGLRNMADALQKGLSKDATAEDREAAPDPMNTWTVMRYAAALLSPKPDPVRLLARAPQFVEPGSSPSVPRNSKCPCNSGKKYKQCCGKARVALGSSPLAAGATTGRIPSSLFPTNNA